MAQLTLRSALLGGIALGLAPAVTAQEGDTARKVEDTVYVFGTQATYAPGDSAGATRTDTPIVEIPQSLSVVTRDLIDDQAMTTMTDVVRYVPGVIMGQGEGHRDAPALRGNTTTSDFFIDGVRDDLQYLRDTYNVERVEVLKGASGLIFGRGSGGGVINRVTKDVFAAPGVGVVTELGSDALARIALDVGGQASETLGVRVNSVFETADGFRDFAEVERFGLNPTLGLRLSEATVVRFGAEYFSDERVTDRGVPSINGRPLEGFDTAFFGNPDVSPSEAEIATLRGSIEHEFAPGVTLKSTLSYGDYDKFYQNVFAAGAVTPAQTVALAAYNAGTERENLLSQTDLIVSAQAFGLEHQILVGLEFARQTTENLRVEAQFPAAGGAERLIVSLADRGRNAQPVFGRVSVNSTSDLDVISLLVQDQIALGESWKLLLGARYDRFDLSIDNRIGASFSREDSFVSPRVGAIWQPMPSASLYASYSQSFLPQSGDQFATLNATSAQAEPEEFTTYEVGGKWEITPELLLTSALYRIERSNSLAPGAAPGTVVQTGETRADGFELSLLGQVTPDWDVVAAYAWQDVEITSPLSGVPAGRRPTLTPENTVSVWNKYAITDRFAVGLGVVHQGESFASISNAVVLPAFTRADAAIFFDLNDRASLQVNVENLTDEDYFPTSHSDNNITPGAPTRVRARLTTRF